MCDCIDKVNKTLAEHNTRLDLANVINMKTGVMSLVVEVPTKKINPRKPKLRMEPIYCPFCGVKR